MTARSRRQATTAPGTDRAPRLAEGSELRRRHDEIRARPRAQDYIVFADEPPRFSVRVIPNGKRLYLIQYRRHARTRRMALGQHGVVTAEIARREANRMLAPCVAAGMIRPRCTTWNASGDGSGVER